MLFGNREPRSVVARRRAAFRPACLGLEDRCLLAAAIDLGANTPPTLPSIATTPYGINLGGANANEGAGYSVADIGDVNGDGYDDFLIGGPKINTQFGLANGSSTVYLVFGSSSANGNSISNWLQNSNEQRVGDLGQLGNTSQTNPVDGNSGFPFNGVKIITSQQANSNLGASVAAAVR